MKIRKLEKLTIKELNYFNRRIKKKLDELFSFGKYIELKNEPYGSPNSCPDYVSQILPIFFDGKMSVSGKGNPPDKIFGEEFGFTRSF